MNNNMNQSSNLGEALRIFLLFALLLFGGGGLGILLVYFFSPGSALADFFGFFVFPLCLGVSMTIWYYMAGTILFGRLAKIFLKNRRSRKLKEDVFSELAQQSKDKPLPGIFIFVPTCTIISLLGGILIGFNPSANFWLNVIVFTLTGFLYGLILRKLVLSGKISFPESA